MGLVRWVDVGDRRRFERSIYSEDERGVVALEYGSNVAIRDQESVWCEWVMVCV